MSNFMVGNPPNRGDVTEVDTSGVVRLTNTFLPAYHELKVTAAKRVHAYGNMTSPAWYLLRRLGETARSQSGEVVA